MLLCSLKDVSGFLFFVFVRSLLISQHFSVEGYNVSTGGGFSERILGEVIYRGVSPKQLYLQIINTLLKRVPFCVFQLPIFYFFPFRAMT